MLLSLFSCARSPEEPLRVAATQWPGYASMHLAQSLGYIGPTQVRLLQMASATQATHALRNEIVDAAALTLDEALVLLQDGVDLRVVLVMDVSSGADAVMARPDIASLADLRGKRIGVETTATGAVVLDAMLAASDLDATEIRLVALPVNEHAGAYLSGKIDAVVTYEPTRSILLEQGARVLFDSSQMPGRIIDVLVVRVDALADQQQHVRDLVAAHFRALDYLARYPVNSSERLAPYLGVTADRVLPQFAGLKLPDLAGNRAQLSGPNASLPATASDLSELMLRRHLLQSPLEIDQLADPAFLPSDTD